MSSDHEAEIRASVGAHADLGPGYDDAVAEGLVERIGAEIDKRIDARLGQLGAVPGTPGPAGSPGYQGPAAPAGAQPGVPTSAGAYGAAPAGAAGMPGAGRVAGATGPVAAADAVGAPGGAGPAPGYHEYQAPIGYQGYQGYMGPVLPPGYQLGPPPVRPSSVGQRSVAMTITALGSMALGVGATAIVSRVSTPAAQAFMVLLIWVAIAIVNVAYARRS
jgi:hypothetical protein